MKKKDVVLKNKKIFKKIFKNKTSFYSLYFTFIYKPNDVKHLRYAILISKKNEKKAVHRNKIKRQIRSILRNCEFNKYFFDVVIIPKKAFLNFNFENKKKDLLKAIDKFWIKFNKN